MTRHYTRNPAIALRQAERQAKWGLLYRNGNSLQEIGDRYGVSREYVRQQLAMAGLNRNFGGIRVGAWNAGRARHEASARKEDERAMRVFGVPAVVVCQIADTRKVFGSSYTNKILRPYIHQKNSAKHRGIEWKLTLADWWRIWQESGKWLERGRGKGYCMARWGDEGPYSAENVYICTIGQNFSDSYITKPARGRFAKRVGMQGAKGYYRTNNKSNPFLAQFAHRHLGYFATESEARAAYLTARDGQAEASAQ